MIGSGRDGGLALNILYVHHAGAFGGASRSLLELIEGFPAGSITPHLVTQRGSVARTFSSRGIEVIESTGISRFDHTSFSHYQGRRWLLLLREAIYLPFTFLALLRARWKWTDIDLVHVNEIVAVPAIVISRILFRCPVVVHVRSVQDMRHDRLRSRFVHYLLKHYAVAVIAIDETVRRSLAPGIEADVVHNAYTPQSGAAEIRDQESPLPPKQPGILRVAMVGNALGFKGVREFVEAARLCRDRHLPVEFVLVGVDAGKNPGPIGWLLKAAGFIHEAGDELRRFIAEHGLEGNVRLFGFTHAIGQVYGNIDILCFPSHLDAAGRPVFEAAFWKVPSIVAVRDPQPDTLVHRETGLRIDPGNPQAIVEAVEYCCRNAGEVARMGEAAYRLALQNFDSHRNADQVLQIYRRVLEIARAMRTPA
jgi:glycosyltransferase involved in cell wall biosynthesis